MNQSTITFRDATPADTAAMLAIYAPFVLNTTTSFECEVPTLQAFEQRVKTYQATNPWIVCEVNGEFAGYAYATIFRSRGAYRFNREVSVYLSKAFRGKGLGAKLYDNLFERLRAQGIKNVIAVVSDDTGKSCLFHETYGFNKIGVFHKVGFKFGKWRNSHWYEFFLE